MWPETAKVEWTACVQVYEREYLHITAAPPATPESKLGMSLWPALAKASPSANKICINIEFGGEGVDREVCHRLLGVAWPFVSHMCLHCSRGVPDRRRPQRLQFVF